MPEEILPGEASPVERRSRPRTEPVLPGDHAGAETLELLAEAPQYNRWQFDMVARYLGVYDGLLATGRPADLRGEQLRCAE